MFVHTLLQNSLFVQQHRLGLILKKLLEVSRGRIFLYKMNTAYKEARETSYWLRLIQDTGLAQGKELDPVVQEAIALSKILRKSLATANENDNQL